MTFVRILFAFLHRRLCFWQTPPEAAWRDSFALEEDRNTVLITLRPRSPDRGDAAAGDGRAIPGPWPPAGRGRHKRRRVLRIPPGVAAVLIPAHNEGKVIGATIASALQVYTPRDIYVFADGCSDDTVAIARAALPADNVIDHRQNIGKSRGIACAMESRILTRDYVYVTVLDADTRMQADYLQQALRVLRRKGVACVVGQVKSLERRKSLIVTYRSYMNTVFQTFHKRPQDWFNAVSIASGTSTTWKTSVYRRLEPDHRFSTEDIHLTVQVHRRGLGRVRYVPSAVVWTQEPFSFSAYCAQMRRWTRAWWETVRKHRLGVMVRKPSGSGNLRLSPLDVVTTVLMLDMLLFWLNLVLIPVLLVLPVQVTIGDTIVQARAIGVFELFWQYIAFIVTALIASVMLRRLRVFLYSPVYFLLAYMDFAIILRSLFSVIRSQYPRVKAHLDPALASIWISPEREEVA